jgi:hypothetical protein
MHWSGDASGTSNPVTITMTDDRLLLADFDPLCFTLTLASNPPAVGNISPDVSPDCHNNTQYSYGTVVQLTATGTNSYDFTDWSGSISGSVNPTLITMNANKSINANYIFADHIAPTAISSLRANPDPTDAASVSYTVTFSEAVTGVDVADFIPITSGITGASVTGVTGSGTIYTVTVNTGTGSGYIRLDVADNDTIIDSALNKLGGTGQGNGGFNNGEFYTVRVDATSPTVISSLLTNSNPTSAANVNFTVTFSETVTNVDAADFSLTAAGISGASVVAVTGSGATYTVKVKTGSSNGTLRLNVPASASIYDVAGNPLGSLPYTGGQVYTVNKTLTLTSIDSNDGWILESGETSGMGGSMNSSATTFYLGDNAAKKQYRGILSFNTGANLPDKAVITEIALKLKKSAVVGGGDPLDKFKGFMADVKTGFFGTAALQTSDFQTPASKTYGPFSPALIGGWYSINLTSAGPSINKLSTGSGLTQIPCGSNWTITTTQSRIISAFTAAMPLRPIVRS